MGNGLREGTPPWVCRWRRACGPPRVLWVLWSFAVLLIPAAAGIVERVGDRACIGHDPSG